MKVPNKFAAQRAAHQMERWAELRGSVRTYVEHEASRTFEDCVRIDAMHMSNEFQRGVNMAILRSIPLGDLKHEVYANQG